MANFKKNIKRIAFWINLLCVAALLLSYASSIISPKYLWHLAFFGLFYPAFLLLNLAFVFFWAWRRNWLALMSLVVILIGWSFVIRLVQINVFSPKKDKFEFTSVLSYNVRLFNHYHQKGENEVQDEIMQFVSGQNPEIVCFQEFLTIIERGRDSEVEIDSALSFLPYHHKGYIDRSNTSSNYGIATYSKHPIVGRASIRFKDSYNSGILSDIAIGEDTIRVFNVHLQSVRLRKTNAETSDSISYKIYAEHFDDVKDISGRLKMAYMKRAQQVKELRAHIENSPYPVIVCGDFNDTPVSYTYQQVRGKLEDAFIGSGLGFGNTYRGQFPYFRIDFIFHSSKYKSYNYKTHNIKLSDHYPISCSLFKY